MSNKNMMARLTYKKYLAAGLLIALAFIAFGPQLAAASATPAAQPLPSTSGLACGWTHIGNMPECAVYYLADFIDYILGLLVTLGAYLVGLGLNLDEAVFSSSVVQAGFSDSLALANLGFVIGIIVIAIATILRRQTYGIKQLLWKLVVMAIFVNFGLVVTAPIVGFSDSLTTYFVQKTSPSGNSSFSTTLLTAFDPSNLYAPPPSSSNTSTAAAIAKCEANLPPPPALSIGENPNTIPIDFNGTEACEAIGKPSSGSDSVTREIISLVFSAIFLGTIAFTLGTISILLLLRYFWLSMLLILLPLAWLAWVFPSFSSWFTRWWSEFIRWALFPAITMFFIYLAMTTVSSVGNAPPQFNLQGSQGPNPAINGLNEETGNPGVVQDGLNDLLLVGLCLGGIIVANSLSLKGAKATLVGARSATNGVRKYAWGKTKPLRDRVRTAGKQFDSNTKETTTALQRFGSKLQGIPLLRNAGTKIARTGSLEVMKKDREKDIKDYIDGDLKSLTNQGLTKLATSRLNFKSPMQSAAIGQELARRNLTLDPSIVPLMPRFLQSSEKMGNMQAILNNRPDLVQARQGEDRDQALKRSVGKIKVADIQEIDHRTLGDQNAAGVPTVDQMNIALNISNPQLGRLGNEGSAEQVEAIRNTVRQARNQLAANPQSLSPEQQRNLTRIIDYTTNSTLWQTIT